MGSTPTTSAKPGGLLSRLPGYKNGETEPAKGRSVQRCGSWTPRQVYKLPAKKEEVIGLATPRKGKAEETPGYCKAEDLANLFALTGQWINQLTRDGILKKRDTPAGKRYNVVESTRSYVQYLREKAAGRGEKGIPESKEFEKFEAELKIKRAKAQIAELEAQELQGTMHRSEDVAALTEDLLYTVRDSLLALPGRLAVDVAAASTAAEAAVTIKREVSVGMKDLSGDNAAPAQYAERVRQRMDWQAEHEGEDDE